MRFLRFAKDSFLIGLIMFGSMCGGSTAAPPAQNDNTCGGPRGFDASQAVHLGECGPGDHLISGTIVRDTGMPFSYDGPLELSQDSAVLVTLVGSYGDVRGDAPVEAIATQIIAPVPSFPISYCLSGDLAKALGYRQLLIDAEVRQHANTFTVGDLIEEFLHEVTLPKTAETIHVTGMEKCGTPSSGGFCLCR